MEGLDFLDDSGLQKTIEDSTEYLYTIFEEAKKDNKSQLYLVETYRVIILYTVSVIEAVLLTVYKKLDSPMYSTEYTHVHNISGAYQNAESLGSPVILAVQKKVIKKDHQIGMNDLIIFFKEKGLIKQPMVDELLKINDLRNTFHLSRSRTSTACTIAEVEVAFKLLVSVITRAQKILENSVGEI